MPERIVSSRLSGDLIDMLLKRGMTLTAIAESIGVTKSFLSRVKSRTRSLTVDHLMALESALGEPLPALLVEATPIESVPRDLQPLYRSTLKVLTVGRSKPAHSSRRTKAA
jgi:transcriptional regulator with XRE-family HTH domain